MKETVVVVCGGGMWWKIFNLSILGCFCGSLANNKNLYDLDNSPVQELDHESYHHLIEKEKLTMIVFYAPVSRPSLP
jgi:hypothetical protein